MFDLQPSAPLPSPILGCHVEARAAAEVLRGIRLQREGRLCVESQLFESEAMAPDVLPQPATEMDCRADAWSSNKKNIGDRKRGEL